MKFLHVSDIHLGKRLHGCSLSEDHRAILEQMLALAARPDVDAVLIAGDVYNRASPSPEAIAQFSAFLTSLAALDKPVCIVRGNHDGEAQLSYAAPLLAGRGIHISRPFDGGMECVELADRFGPVRVWLLPYIRPAQARAAFPDAKIENYADALRVVLAATPPNPSVRNVLVTHQYVSGALVSDSEERSIGGLDQIPPELFDGYDYVALGHLHRAQTLREGRLRYCGAPLVYSFDECAQSKSATLVTLGAKGEPNAFETVPFQPPHACRRLEGTLEELCALPRSEDYIQAVLTDTVRPLDPLGALRIPFPNLLNLMFVRANFTETWEEIPERDAEMDPLEHFAAFYTYQNKQPPSDQVMEIMRGIIAGGGMEA